MIITDYANFRDELLIFGSEADCFGDCHFKFYSGSPIWSSDSVSEMSKQAVEHRGLGLEFALLHPLGPPEAMQCKLSLTQTSACVLWASVTKQRLMTVDEAVFSLVISGNRVVSIAVVCNVMCLKPSPSH